MSLILALETATEQSSVALLEEDTLVCGISFSHGRDLSRMLMTAVEDCLKLAQRSLKQVDAVACSVGPGSFTGLRIGVTAAKTLAFALEKPVIAISTLQALAASVPLSSDSIVVPVIDARRNELFTAVFKHENGRMERLADDALMPAADLARFASAEAIRPSFDDAPGAQIIVVAAAALMERLRETFTQGLPASFLPAFPHAYAVAALGREALNRGETLRPVDLIPSYLRRSYAEEKFGGDAA